MRVLITGSRTITDPAIVAEAIAGSGFRITEVVSGGVPGVDALGSQWAELCGIPVKHFTADRGAYGRMAGTRRDWDMAEYADALLAIDDGKTLTTRNMICTALTIGLAVSAWQVSHRIKRQLDVKSRR